MMQGRGEKKLENLLDTDSNQVQAILGKLKI